MEVLEIIGIVLGLVFLGWPLVLLAPLQWARKSKMLWSMQVMWILMLVGWWFARSMGQLPSLLIPEPYNTYLFFGAGAILLLIIPMVQRIGRLSR
jgi:hypothetical protein